MELSCKKYPWIIGVLATALLSSCSFCKLREAQDVVAQADSLWAAGQMYGREAGDSATLAQAYETLNNIPSSLSPQLSTSFAHACYHYGRLLRERENSAAAMEAFIHATHSRTHDYHILGRVYSNIGDICHLAGEYPLSYDMFERSANYFLKNGDSLLYYYGLNNMAYELAEQGRKKETLSLLDSISNCPIEDGYLNECCSLTKAKAFLANQQNDSAIYYAKQITCYRDIEISAALIIAQAYDNSEKNDSALIYANKVLADSLSSYQNKFNALFIVRNNDSTLCAQEIGALYSQREDIRFYEYEPEKKKLTQSVLILKQDIDRVAKYRRIKPYLIGVLFVFLTIIVYYICRAKQRKRLFLQEKQNLEKREKAISKQQNKYNQDKNARRQEIENRCNVLHNTSNLKEQLHWRQYDEMCRSIDEQFYLLAGKLKQQQNFNERDVRLCVLVLLDLSHTDISKMMYVEESSVGKLKERTAKKLHTSRKNMRQTLLEIVLGDSFSDSEMKLSSSKNI